MEPVRNSVTIDLPREEVFEYLADIANHPEFLGEFVSEWRLTRVDSYGYGAGARFHIDAPFWLSRYSWADLSFSDVTPPRRIIAVGRGGKFNRTKHWWEWTLSETHDGTQVELSIETDPGLASDSIMEGFGYRGWLNRKAKKSLKRLRRILEEGGERGQRATVGGLSVPAGTHDG